jgi:hypothetical protein
MIGDNEMNKRRETTVERDGLKGNIEILKIYE